jgi:hypothetical protein
MGAPSLGDLNRRRANAQLAGATAALHYRRRSREAVSGHFFARAVNFDVEVRFAGNADHCAQLVCVDPAMILGVQI